MNKVTVRGKTIEEAVQSALNQLNTTEESVNVRVIEKPKKGFLGFGAKEAVVEVEIMYSDVGEQPNSTERTAEVEQTSAFVHLGKESERDEDKIRESSEDKSEEARVAIDKASQFLEEVLDKMNVPAQIDKRQEKDAWIFDLSGEKMGLLIGRRGQTLNSLQYLTNIVANRHTRQFVRIVLDAEDYRQRRKETLEQLADRMAKKVIRTRAKLALEPMNAAERKIIHTHLQHYAGVATESDGKEPNRHIVIYPK